MTVPARAVISRQLLAAFAIGVAQAMLVCLVIVAGVHGFDDRLRTPLQFSDDTLVYLAQIKSTVDNGWWWHNPMLSAPGTFNALLFPSNSNVDQAVVWLVSRLVTNPMRAANLAWIAIMVLGAWSATYSLRACGLSVVSSVACGTLFALCPYAVYHNLNMFSLVVLLVPFPCAMAVRFASGPSPDADPVSSAPLVMGSALLGFNYVYYAFFGCFVLIVGGLAGWLRRRTPGAMLGALAMVAIIGGGTAANLAPSLLAWRSDGQPIIVRAKVPAESEVYGLKLRQILSPAFQHDFPPFKAWNDAAAAAKFPLETENMVSQVGAVASVGLLIGLAVVIVNFSPAAGIMQVRIASAGQLALAAVLLGTIGGFGSLFSLLISPDIRGWNRISPFIAFFSLLIVGACMDRLRHRTTWLVVAGAVFALGLADQRYAFRGIDQGRPARAAGMAALRTFVGDLEARLAPGSMVLQLPFTTYLNDSGRARMGSYEHFRPYLASTALHWSYPAMSDEQFAWQQTAARLPAAALPAAVAGDGFAAILVDRFGYDDAAAAVIGGLESGGAVQLLSDERYTVFDVRQLPHDAAQGITAQVGRQSTRQLRACGSAPVVAMDSIGTSRGPIQAPVPVASRRPLEVSGWIVDPVTRGPVQYVELAVDGTPLPAAYGFDRPDVAAFFSVPGAGTSGFRARLPGGTLSVGQRQLTIRGVALDGGCYYETAPFVLDVR